MRAPSFQPDTSTDLSAEIFGRVVRPMFSDDIVDNAAFKAVAIDLIRRLCPRDPVEELLVAQMLWTHARAARLSRVSLEQKSLDWFKAYSAEFERSSNLFRRQMKAFDEHRKPRRQFVLTRRASPALAMGPRAEKKKEIGHGPKGLPPVGGGVEVAAKLCLPEPAVVPQYRPEDGGGEGEKQ